VLEQEGFLHQPHTSAGRVPTEKGYRFFVDHLGGPTRLDRLAAMQVRQFFDTRHGELEQMLVDTSRLLSDLTQYAAVVVGPTHETARVRAVQLVSLTDDVGVLVLVLSNGQIDKHTIAFDGPISEAVLARVQVHLAAHLAERNVGDLPPVVPSGDPDVDHLVRCCLEAMVAEPGADSDSVFVGGAARMAAAFDAVETVRRVLGILEQQLVVVTLLRDVLDRGLSVAIGSETGMAPLADCSLVVAPYEVDGEPAGSIGVLGPTRMNYPQALAAVALVSRRLSHRLSES
jgi:heat-inducible transcriptional repressor